MFMVLVIASLAPLVIAVLATAADENVAIHGGFHKHHH